MTHYGTFFTANFFGTLSTEYVNNTPAINTFIAVSTEQQLNNMQRQRLRAARESELLTIELKIVSLQWALAIHLNELIEQRNQAVQAYNKASSQINKAIDLWNRTSTKTKNIVIRSYEQDLLELYLLENIKIRNNELRQITHYYKDSPIAKIYFKNSSNLTEQVEQESINTKEFESLLKGEKARINENIAIIRSLCTQNHIKINRFKQNITNKLAKQKRELLKKELAEATKKFTPPDNPKKDDDKNKTKQKIKISEENAPHIFRNKKNHLPRDTPANRKLLLDLVSDAKNFLGKCSRHGNEWYGKILSNGQQLWARVRNGLIRNGGLNEIPIKFNPETGLNRPFPPNIKL